MKMRLVFDTTDAGSIAASDSVGAYVRADDGTLITATGTSLDVNVSNTSIAVTATDLDIRDLAFATDKVDVSGSSVTVSATDLDIRDLAFATDKVDVSGSSVTVSATDLDIRDLSATQDSVEAWAHDGSGNAITSTTGALDVYVTGSGPLTVNDAALANTAIAAAANGLVANTAEDVVVSPLASRKYLYVLNNGNKDVFIGQSGVTVANGFPISPMAMLELRAGAAIDIEVISSAAGEVRTLELS